MTEHNMTASPSRGFSLHRAVAFACPAIVFLASLTLYVRTMPPGIAVVGYAADTLKFQYIGKILGTPHFGYPTYMFLNILFSRLPFFNLAYRLNLLSALLASATLVVLYFIILFLIRNRIIAFVCALLFGVTYTFWENSIIAEVYSLNTLFMCGVLLLMLEWSETKRPLFFYLGCLVYAVSFGNHLIQITLLPALVYWTFAVDRSVLLKRKTYLLIALFILLGMSQYEYVLWRSYQLPPQEKVFQYWPYVEDFGRTHMEVYATSIPQLFDEVSGGGWRSRLAQYSAGEVVRQRFPFLRDLFLLQFSPAGMILGLSGIGLAFVRDRRRAVFLLLILAAHLGFVATWGIPGVDVHVIPSYLVLTIFIAHNDNLFTLPWFSRHLRVRRLGRACLAVALVGLLAFLTTSRYHKVDQSENVWLDKLTDNVLSEIPDDSFVFTNHVYATAFWYKLYGEDARPGARIKFYPIWRVYPEDLEYALKHYRNVFYFMDEFYWPMIERNGIDFEIVTFRQCGLREYLSSREPGEILATYADMDGGFSAQGGELLGMPNAAPDVFALAGVVEASGKVRVLASAQGPLVLRKGEEREGVKMPSDIVVAPGEDVYVDGRACSRFMKRDNLVLLDAATGNVKAAVYVDWKRSASVEPAHFLRVKRR